MGSQTFVFACDADFQCTAAGNACSQIVSHPFFGFMLSFKAEYMVSLERVCQGLSAHKWKAWRRDYEAGYGRWLLAILATTRKGLNDSLDGKEWESS